MEHVAEDGSYKIVNECTLPYAGMRVVQRIITDLGVLESLELGSNSSNSQPASASKR